MSIHVLSLVWRGGPVDRGQLLVLLAIADYCDDFGACWPSISAISVKARMTERGVQKVIKRLIEDGYLRVEVGGGRHGCNQYQVLMVPDAPANAVHPERRSPRTPKHKPRTPEHETPNPGSPEPSRTVIEPSFSLSAPPKPEKARMPEDWVPDAKDTACAEKLGLIADEIQELANEFRGYWSERTDADARKTENGWHRAWANRLQDRAATIKRNRPKQASGTGGSAPHDGLFAAFQGAAARHS